MPAKGDNDVAFRSYTFVLDSAMDSQWDSLLRVDQKELNGAKRAEISLPTSMGGTGCSTIHTIVPITYIGIKSSH